MYWQLKSWIYKVKNAAYESIKSPNINGVTQQINLCARSAIVP